jgi:hypothetical protein
MRNADRNKEKDTLRPEYDFARLKSRGKGIYAKRYQEGTNLVLLAPDVADVFPDDDAVNEALRTLIRVGHSRAQ